MITKAIHFSGWTGPDGVNFEFESTFNSIPLPSLILIIDGLGEETHKNAHVGERCMRTVVPV